MAHSIEYEVFDEHRPSYAPSHIMSAFVLLAVASLAYYRIPLWPPSVAHVVVAIWFGVLFRWILQNSRQVRTFASSRLRITDQTYAHTFRYAVTEATHVEMPLTEIEEVKVSRTEPRYIEVRGKSGCDMYFLPACADTERLLAAFTKANPSVRITG